MILGRRVEDGRLGGGVLDHGAIKEGPAYGHRLPITQKWGDGR
jgi:hypothetical protein